MDSQRNIYFVIFAMSLVMLWMQWTEFKDKKKQALISASMPSLVDSNNNIPNINQLNSADSTDAVGVPTISNIKNSSDSKVGNAAVPGMVSAVNKDDEVEIQTDVFTLRLSKQGANIVYAGLKKHLDDDKKEFVIMDAGGIYQYSARSGLVNTDNKSGIKLPSHLSKFEFDKNKYEFVGSGVDEKWQVTANAIDLEGVAVSKTFTFYPDKYVIDVDYKVENKSSATIEYSSYYLLNRNNDLPKIGYFGLHTYTGPAYYTEERKFNKASFDDIADDPEDYRFTDDNGYVALIQHYFVSAWVIPKEKQKRQFFFQPESNGKIFSAGMATNAPKIDAGNSDIISSKLYIGPQDQDKLENIADGLQLVVDYGIFTIFAEPLFWVMKFIHKYVGNWGWTIILLTLLIKAIFFPLSAASYRSMAKMRKLSPKIQKLREMHPDNKQKQQQEMMRMYKTEKVNPLGGCLPIMIQIPVFISLYWVLLSSVEMRNQPWMGWIVDLAKPDPYYILPVLYAISMFITTKLNPPPPDPMQRKILMAMPVVFSVIFFFFPSGLVLYWVVNNLITIGQQYYNNKMYA